jgi:hypothetical protein
VAKFGKDGSPLTTQGRETQVYRKDNRRWRIVSVHYSDVPVTGETGTFNTAATRFCEFSIKIPRKIVLEDLESVLAEG